ncbi:unnamed protein product [Prorocentrum cordatum]|uniref:Uncharacterized protein n=1 Tax=Prorocentrum cordatum TaxID=2364126 RepID=A0ABN9TF35_9DINO|nr:unnamed protein product [Polarella glacialis]
MLRSTRRASSTWHCNAASDSRSTMSSLWSISSIMPVIFSASSGCFFAVAQTSLSPIICFCTEGGDRSERHRAQGRAAPPLHGRPSANKSHLYRLRESPNIIKGQMESDSISNARPEALTIAFVEEHVAKRVIFGNISAVNKAKCTSKFSHNSFSDFCTEYSCQLDRVFATCSNLLVVGQTLGTMEKHY